MTCRVHKLKMLNVYLSVATHTQFYDQIRARSLQYVDNKIPRAISEVQILIKNVCYSNRQSYSCMKPRKGHTVNRPIEVAIETGLPKPWSRHWSIYQTEMKSPIRQWQPSIKDVLNKSVITGYLGYGKVPRAKLLTH